MKLAYKKLGAGTPLLILHGLFGSSDNWATIARTLSQHFEVFLIDNRNHGHSPHDSEMNYEVMSEDVKAFVEEHQLSKINLVGHSMGGKIAMLFAAKYPQYIENLIIVDISPRGYDLSESTEEMNHAQLIDIMQSIDLENLKTRQEVDAFVAQQVKEISLRLFLLKNLYFDKHGNWKWRINLPVLQSNLSKILAGIDSKLFALQNFSNPYPTLFLRGEHSNYILESDKELIFNLFHLPKVHTITNAGHWLHAEQAQQFITALLNFTLHL